MIARELNGCAKPVWAGRIGRVSARARLFSPAAAFVLVALLFFVSRASQAGEGAPSDFTFLHVTDVHTPEAKSPVTISRIGKLGEIPLPDGVLAAKPQFAIVTGDLTEFGGGSGWWEQYVSFWKDSGLQHYEALGNHDNTWHGCIKAMRDAGYGPYYSFDHGGCHFIALMTATAQDPRPSIGEEEIQWLKGDLRKAGHRKPVFVYFHHPLDSAEYASRYDSERLLDVLRGYNIVLLLAGHIHRHGSRPIGGVDAITGSPTFGPDAGFTVVSLKKGILRAAYWKDGEPAPSLKMLEKPIATQASYPEIELVSPDFRASVDRSLRISARIRATNVFSKATYTIDDELSGELALSGGSTRHVASGTIDVSTLLSGAHYLRVAFVAGDKEFTRSTEFFCDGGQRQPAWRAWLGASTKVTPAVVDGTVFVGANDGGLTAFKASTGKRLWSVQTGAEILAEPCIYHGQVFTANGLGKVAAYGLDGRKLWTFTAHEAVYSSPIMAEGRLIFGCNDGGIYALDPATGTGIWTNNDASYSVESKPFAWDGKVFYGAWDQYIRCLSARNGSLIWKQVGEGSRVARGAKRYYSPGDSMPIVAGGRVMIADRSYFLTMLDAQTGEVVGSRRGVSATGLSADGQSVYLRQTNGQLTKMDASGHDIWSVNAKLDSLPTVPIERDGVVYVCSSRGTVSALAAETGVLLWQYQVSPQLYVMSSLACDGVNVYATAFDGTLTAIPVRAVK